MADFIKDGSLRIITIDPNKIRKVDISQLGTKTMGQWYNSQLDKPKYMINASLWDTKGPIGTIYLDGKMTRNEGNGFGFGTVDNKTFDFAKPWDKKWKDYITGYPALVWNGKPTTYTVDSYVQNSKNKRSAVAEKDGNLLLITSDALTLNKFRQELVRYGVDYAINLDGGGSTRMLVDGKAVNYPTDDRKCKLAISVWMEKEMSSEEEINNACRVLSKKLNLSEDTINYLLKYKYGKELVLRIVKNLK